MLAVVGVALIAIPTAPVVLGLQQQPPATELVDELVSLEERLTGVPLVPSVTTDPEEPWGTIRGDFIGAAFQIDEVADELTSLVERASESDGPVPRAVRDVASAYRTMREGYRHLEEYEAVGLGVVVDGDLDDEDDVAVEEARGHAETGLRLLLEALAGFHEGYEVLRDADAAADARTLFESRYDEVVAAAESDGVRARELLSYPSTQLLVPVERFGQELGSSPARTVRYVCVDRDAYLEQRPAEPVAPLPLPEGDQSDVPYPDCPALPGEAGATAAVPTEE